MSNPKIDRKDAIKELWYRGILTWKLHPVQQKMLASYIEKNSEITVIGCARRLGKCLAEGTEVLTPTGPIKIEELNPGDLVYGFNKDGSISETKVIAVEYQGEKEVIEIKNNSRVLAESTKDHRWCFTDTTNGEFIDSSLNDIKDLSRKKITRRFIKIPGGNIREQHAYALGALLGDGCSRQGSNTTVYISSEDEVIPRKVAGIIGSSYHKNSSVNNYTWHITNAPFGRGLVSKKTPLIKINYYNEWCKDRYAHQKIVDLDVIKQWDRWSRLELLAGLLDTDGSIGVNSNVLTIQFSSQSISLIKAVQYLIKSLVHYDVNISKDKRDKYVNGPCYHITLRNNLISKKLLKELDPHLVLSRKKWQPEYEFLNENNSHPDYVGIHFGKTRISRTWDIQVDNETNWYVLANGLITHNSYLLCTLALEECLKRPNSIVKYVCPKKNMVGKILNPIMNDLLSDCPPELKPEFKYNDSLYQFPNGSQIQMAGTDNGHHENIRGGSSNLWIVDEAGFCDDLKYVVNTILAPTTDTTGGRGIIASTPSKTPDHEFIIDFMQPWEYRGDLIKYTIYDNPMLSKAKVQSIIDRYPLKEKDPEFRREYLVEVVQSNDTAVIPEFSPELQAEIVKEYPRPPFFDAYVSMDIGGKDMTFLVFAYYDFKNGIIVVEDELAIPGKEVRLDKLAQDIRTKEEELYTNKLSSEFKPPYLRVADNNNLILLNDLSTRYNIQFLPTRKDNREAALNTMRIKLAERRIIIHPRCKTLIHHLKSASWNKKKTDFLRLGDGSHADGLAALMYLVRNIQEHKNPYPSGYGMGKLADMFMKSKDNTPSEQQWINLFKSRKN